MTKVVAAAAVPNDRAQREKISVLDSMFFTSASVAVATKKSYAAQGTDREKSAKFAQRQAEKDDPFDDASFRAPTAAKTQRVPTGETDAARVRRRPTK